MDEQALQEDFEKDFEKALEKDLETMSMDELQDLRLELKELTEMVERRILKVMDLSPDLEACVRDSGLTIHDI